MQNQRFISSYFIGLDGQPSSHSIERVKRSIVDVIGAPHDVGEEYVNHPIFGLLQVFPHVRGTGSFIVLPLKEVDREEVPHPDHDWAACEHCTGKTT